MRWRPAQLGDRKVVRKFLLFPMRFGEDARWLEFAMVEYVYGTYTSYDENGPYECVGWNAVRFIVDNHTSCSYLKATPTQETHL